jgi:hypothetical protein
MQFQETADVLICWNCAVLIANGDCLECVEASTNIDYPVCTHGPDASCAGWEISVGEEEDTGWRMGQRCWSCGVTSDGDQWCSATAFMYTAEHWVMRATALLVAARSIREGLWLAGEHATPAQLLNTACEYGRLAVKARDYARKYLTV